MDECSSIPIELFTKTGGKATGHSPHCTQRVLKSLCAETWPIRGGKKTKQYFFCFCFCFLSQRPPKNFGDLSHRAPQRNKEKRKLLCLFYRSPSEWLLFDGGFCVCVCAGLKGWEQSILNGTVIWRAGEYINIAFGMHFPLNKVSEQVYLLKVYYWHFHYHPSNTKLFQRTYDSEQTFPWGWIWHIWHYSRDTFSHRNFPWITYEACFREPKKY